MRLPCIASIVNLHKDMVKINFIITWKTVSNAIGKVLKLVGGVPSSKLNCPPNSCMPSSAKMRMKRKRRNSREMMDLIELRRDITRFLSDDQYLVT